MPLPLLSDTKTELPVKWFYERKYPPSYSLHSFFFNSANPDFECFGPDELNYVHRTVSPYLYPFIIEFNILIVGIWYMIWANISHCPKKLSAPGHGHHHGHDAEKTDHSDENNNQHSIESGHGKPNGKSGISAPKKESAQRS